MLYHVDIGLPAIPDYGTIWLKYSHHAIQASYTDKHGHIVLPEALDTGRARVIEAEIDQGTINKILYRISYSKDLDLCLVIIPQKRLVKTVWLNSRTDQHKTLDKSKYCAIVR